MLRGLGQDDSRPRRLFLFAVIAVSLAHLALLAVWLVSHSALGTPPPGRAGAPVLAYLDFAGPTASAPARPDVLETPTKSSEPETDPARMEPIAHPEDLGLPAPRADGEPEPVSGVTPPPNLAAVIGPAEPADPCHFAQSLETALQNNDTVQSVLALIPQNARSVANAVMLWDGGWVSVNMPDGQARLEPLRATIVETLSASPADCRDRLNSGPILFAIAGPAGTTVLALGSGPWRASDVIAKDHGDK